MTNFPFKTIWFVVFLCLLIRGVLEFSGGSYIFGKFLHTSYRIVLIYRVPWLYTCTCSGLEVLFTGRDINRFLTSQDWRSIAHNDTEIFISLNL
jgi:hypothetical protein